MEWCDIVKVIVWVFVVICIWLCKDMTCTYRRCVIMSVIIVKNYSTFSQESLGVCALLWHSSSTARKFHSFDPIQFDYVTQIRVLLNKLIFSSTRKPLLFFICFSVCRFESEYNKRISTHLNACTCTPLPTIFIQKISRMCAMQWTNALGLRARAHSYIHIPEASNITDKRRK